MRHRLVQAIKRGLDVLFRRQRRLLDPSGVLLTFDDGPHPVVTPQVLERLATWNVRAVFFVVGSRLERAPEMLNAILTAGHYLGNHSFAHRLDRDPWFFAYCWDVWRCQRLLVRRTGHRPKLFRPPMGRSSLGALVAPRLLGLRHLLWSLEADDWAVRDLPAACRCAEKLCTEVTGGDIILLHDDHPWIVPILDRLLPVLCKKGFDLRPALFPGDRPGRG